MSHFTKKCNSFHFYPNIKKPEVSCPELWIPFVFSKRNSFKKAQKQVVITKLFMNVHFCILGMKTYRCQLVKNHKSYLAGTIITQFIKSLSNKTGLE